MPRCLEKAKPGRAASDWKAKNFTVGQSAERSSLGADRGDIESGVLLEYCTISTVCSPHVTRHQQSSLDKGTRGSADIATVPSQMLLADVQILQNRGEGLGTLPANCQYPWWVSRANASAESWAGFVFKLIDDRRIEAPWIVEFNDVLKSKLPRVAKPKGSANEALQRRLFKQISWGFLRTDGLGWFASQGLTLRGVDLRRASLTDQDKGQLASLVDPALFSLMRRLQTSPKRKGTAPAPAPATKRKRTESPENSKSPRPNVRLEGDKKFTQIPTTARKASDLAQEAANQAQEAANRAQEAVQEAQDIVQQAQDTHIPIAKTLVEDEVKRLAAAGVQVKELRIDNAELKTELTAKNEAMASMQKLLDSTTAKIKAAENDRESFQKELGAEKERSQTKDAEMQAKSRDAGDKVEEYRNSLTALLANF
ncbi:hypothetical protein DFH06DRAFT_1362866 [Mycena polygramma]|nr:hypothetical protein DFH06DRAFT_1362866 [Mycena polygramma]